MRMSAITTGARHQSIPKVQDLISECKKRLLRRSSHEIKVMLPLHDRNACDFPSSLIWVPVHPEMDKWQPKLLYKPH